MLFYSVFQTLCWMRNFFYHGQIQFDRYTPAMQNTLTSVDSISNCRSLAIVVNWFTFSFAITFLTSLRPPLSLGALNPMRLVSYLANWWTLPYLLPPLQPWDSSSSCVLGSLQFVLKEENLTFKWIRPGIPQLQVCFGALTAMRFARAVKASIFGTRTDPSWVLRAH